MWKKIQQAIESIGVDCYPPATKQGECTSPYVVVKLSGASQISNFSSMTNYIDIMIYVPKSQYTELEEVKKRIEECLDGLYPMIAPAGTETPDYYDDSVKAHMKSIMYRFTTRNLHL